MKWIPTLAFQLLCVNRCHSRDSPCECQIVLSMMAEIQLIRREEVTISGLGHVVREPEHTRLRATDPVIRLHRGSHNDGTTLRVLALVDSGRAAWTLLFTAFIFEARPWVEACELIDCDSLMLIASMCRLYLVLWCIPRLLLEYSRI